MTPFEDELRKALARREPREDFTARVLAQTGAGEATRHKRHSFLFGWTLWRFAVTAALVLMLSSGFLYRRHVHRVEGERAKQQLLTAMHIAGAELRQAQQRVERIQFSEVVAQ
jgi:hypothetical protein